MRLILLFILLTGTIDAIAQRSCLSSEYTEQLRSRGEMNNSPEFSGRLRDTLPDETIIIPVVIHVIYNTPQQNISTAQIMSQIDALNRDFSLTNNDVENIPNAFRGRAADTKIRFCLAKVDPKGRLTTGIVRKKTSKEYFMGDDAMKFTTAGGDDSWDSQRYLNIWVCNMFGRSLGYATMPGAPANKDGLVINWDVFGTIGTVRPPFNKGRTATHEIGHWMGLKHIWGDDICGSDDVDDTPPQKSYNYYCPVFPKVSNCSADANGDMFMNFMDLTDDGCMNLFTNGQKRKMRSVFSLTGHRNSFLYSAQCDSSIATGGPVAEDTVIFVQEKPEPQINIYPNPVSSKLNIVPVNDFQLHGIQCSIYNMQGKVVYNARLSAHRRSIDISALIPGIYYLKLGEGPSKKIHKIVKI